MWAAEIKHRVEDARNPCQMVSRINGSAPVPITGFFQSPTDVPTVTRFLSLAASITKVKKLEPSRCSSRTILKLLLDVGSADKFVSPSGRLSTRILDKKLRDGEKAGLWRPHSASPASINPSGIVAEISFASPDRVERTLESPLLNTPASGMSNLHAV